MQNNTVDIVIKKYHCFIYEHINICNYKIPIIPITSYVAQCKCIASTSYVIIRIKYVVVLIATEMYVTVQCISKFKTNGYQYFRHTSVQHFNSQFDHYHSESLYHALQERYPLVTCYTHAFGNSVHYYHVGADAVISSTARNPPGGYRCMVMSLNIMWQFICKWYFYVFYL